MISARKARKEVARIRTALDAFHPLNLGRGLTTSESEVVAYLKRDLSRFLPLTGESAPVVSLGME